MPLESSADPALRESLADFLLATFRLGADAPFVEPALLSWKYDAPRPDWSGPRSFVWKDGGAIVAHACMCPVTYSVPSADVTGSPSGDITGSPSGDLPGSPSGDLT